MAEGTRQACPCWLTPLTDENKEELLLRAAKYDLVECRTRCLRALQAGFQGRDHEEEKARLSSGYVHVIACLFILYTLYFIQLGLRTRDCLPLLYTPLWLFAL